jgi:cysteine synthase A
LVVEATAGNTGIGLALVASARDYRTVIVIPGTQSQEKKDTLRLLGAQLVEVPARPYGNPNNYQHVGRRLADELRKDETNGVLFADQWNNLDNRKAHYVSTGPEIWEQTEGKVDAFICSIGTGGTIAGTSTFLRERRKDIVIGVADPRGAAMYHLFKDGEAKATEGGSITEGIGLGRVTRIIEDIQVDKAYLIEDAEAVPIIFDLLEHEGLCLGGSSGINVAGAIRLADLGPGTPSSPFSLTTAPATSRSCSTLSSRLARPAGMDGAQGEIAVPFVKVTGGGAGASPSSALLRSAHPGACRTAAVDSRR